jgi:hypothetical protein
MTSSKARILKYYINDEKFCFRFRNNFLSETQLLSSEIISPTLFFLVFIRSR